MFRPPAIGKHKYFTPLRGKNQTQSVCSYGTLEQIRLSSKDRKQAVAARDWSLQRDLFISGRQGELLGMMEVDHILVVRIVVGVFIHQDSKIVCLKSVCFVIYIVSQ